VHAAEIRGDDGEPPDERHFAHSTLEHQKQKRKHAWMMMPTAGQFDGERKTTITSFWLALDAEWHGAR
jgi:hypothetical protein